jgi:diguanylate cyclase (GGDEF)-like protein
MANDDQINHATGLFTRPLLEILLQHEISRAQRYPSPLTLLRLALFIPQGDYPRDLAHLLIADLLNTNLRATDVPGHFDDDYLILLPATPRLGGLTVASRLAHHAKILHPVEQGYGDHFDLAVCIGLSSHEGGSEIGKINLLAQASTALDDAKRKGAHSVVIFNELEK